jgi:glucose-1-phosphate cytidylyltransferase
MKTVILAGGRGTRLAEETAVVPKPMVEIGGRPILWHIMKHYSSFGFTDFGIALGYRGEVVKRYMIEYSALHSDLTVETRSGRVETTANGRADDWTVALVDTGLDTATGGRIKRMAPYAGDETFMLTWGDGLSTVALDRLLEFHRAHGKLATVTVVRPPARFGHLHLKGDTVFQFSEKPQLEEVWINGAFFVLEPGVFDYVEGDETEWEREPLEQLARDGQLMAYRHDGFWQCMDTVRDKQLLEELWASGSPPWKLWP